MNGAPVVLKGCVTVVALSLILQYVVHPGSKLKGRGRGGKVRCYQQGSTSQVRRTVDGGGTFLLRATVVVIFLLLVMVVDVDLKVMVIFLLLVMAVDVDLKVIFVWGT